MTLRQIRVRHSLHLGYDALKVYNLLSVELIPLPRRLDALSAEHGAFVEED